MTSTTGDTRTSPARARRKVLLVTRNFPPLVGGMERYNERIFEQLGRSFETSLAGPQGADAYLSPDIPVGAAPIRPLPFFLMRILCVGLAMARRLRPNVIIAGSGLTAPIAWLIGRLFGARVLVFLYGLDLVVANAWYQAIWLPLIRACDGFLPISEYTRSLAVAKGISAHRMRIVRPGVDMPNADDRSIDIRGQYDLGDRPIILSVGRLTRRKGLIEFINESLPAIVRACPRVVLLVIGGDPADALSGNRGGVTEGSREAAKALGLEVNLRLLGNVPDAAVRAAYQASRVHVFPVREIPGDIEGFGIVALEAASHGVPTVAFAVGGVPDAVDPRRSGRLVAAGDYADMSMAVIGYLQRPATASERESCIGFAEEFAWDRIGVTLTRSVEELTKT